MDVCERIFTLLQEKGKKQKDLADHLGTGTSTIAGWKQENRNPSLGMIVPICEFLGVSPEYLLTGKEGSPRLPEDARELLDTFEKLDSQGKTIVKAKAFEELRRLEG